MADLTQKSMLLLDKLYNLKGDDNLILQEINSKIEGVKNSIDATEEQIKSLDQERQNKTQSLLAFSNQQEAFLTAFSDVGDDTFSALRNIGVDVNIASMVSVVAEKAPIFIQTSQEEIEKIGTNIQETSDHKAELKKELDVLENSRRETEIARKNLQGLMEQSLSSDDSEREALSKGHVKEILGKFGIFDNEEISTLAILIMFPERGLFEYDNGYQERLENGLVGTADTMSTEEELSKFIGSDEGTAEEVEETPVEETVTEEVVEEPVEDIIENGNPEQEHEVQELFRTAEEPKKPEDSNPKKAVAESMEIYDKQKDKEGDATSIIDITSIGAEQEDTPTEEDSIRDYLESLGITLNRFYEENDKEENIDELMSELSSTDKELIASNYEALKALNAEVAAYRYRRGHSYLSDKELSQKLTLLRSKNISENIIKTMLEQADSGLLESLETIKDRFKAAEELGTPIDDEHSDLLGQDLVRLAANISLLKADEINVDDKEIRNFQYVLSHSEFVREDLEILKNYLINIARSNDKYALGVFAKDPYDLITDIDNIIENNLEDVLSTNPEVLSGRSGAFVERVKYFEGLKKPILDTTGKSVYAPYVLSVSEAFKEMGGKVEIPLSIAESEINPLIPEIIGNENTVSSIVDILNEYYKEEKEYKDIDLSDTATEAYARLMERFEQTFHAVSETKYAYKVADEFISKLKLERHLKVIITTLEKTGQSIDGIENEVLLTAMLYNHRQDKETLKKMVETCLGFNEDNTLGGRAL